MTRRDTFHATLIIGAVCAFLFICDLIGTGTWTP